MTTIGRVVKIKLYVDWTSGGSYTAESGNILNASGQIRLAAPLTTIMASRSVADQATVTLINRDQRYSSLLTSGGLYSVVGNGKAYHRPMYIEVSVDGGSTYTRIFTGVIKGYTESVVTGRNSGTITLDCRSREEEILNKKISTGHAQFVAIYTTPNNEGEIIGGWLDAAGLSGADYQLDTGLYSIPWAALLDESAIEQAWDMAAGSGGRFYMRHSDGKFVYQNNQHWVFQSSVKSIARSDYGALSIKYPDPDLCKVVTAQIYTGSIQPNDTIFTLDAPLTVAPGATLVHEATLTDPAYIVGSVAYTATTTGGANITADVTVTMTAYARKLSFSIANANAQAALIRLLTVDGQFVTTNSKEKVTATSTDTFWTDVAEKKRALSNRYVQSRGQAGGVAALVLAAGETPLVNFAVDNLIGDPTLRVGDLVTIADGKVMTTSVPAFVTALSWRFGTAGFFQSLECIEAAQLFPYYNTSPGYFRLGTNKLGSSDPLRARMFF